MSDDDIFMETMRAANAAEYEGGQPTEEESPVEETVAGEDSRVFAGKYQSADDLENAYLELQRKFHESRQPDPEPEYQQQQVAPAYFGSEPSTEAEVVSFAENDPSNAAMWVINNTDRLPSDLANAVLEHWWAQKPWEATQYFMEQRLASERDQLTNMTMPLVEQHERAVMADAYDRIVDAIPDYDDYQERVEQFISERDVSGIILPGSEQDPVALAEGIGTIVGIIKWHEYQTAMRNQGMIVPDQESTQPSMVSTRNTTNPTDLGGDEIDDLIRNMILNA
ncbi:hypothetical protein UFOVP929_31 [uncultured Caudovirales phage]|uniref:Uncharacterized protein n=1 Tax=uncultured Caudovirales phage TaxID=2100421 RepID=A0A6J5PX11_9CAUD|nr:hypothetical protein UFOVP929_31 [uncultured Caudovirales phage]